MWHPVTLEPGTTQKDFVALLAALDEQCDTQFIFTKANADTDGRIVNQMIDEYVSGCPDRAVSHTSLGQLRYLSALKYVDGIVGNSSSGIIEAPSLATGTVNIGDRQRGRIRAVSIIDVPPDKDQISGAIKRLFSEDFKLLLSGIHNPYDGGEDVSGRIVERLRLFPLEGIVKKSFYNYPVRD